jgi:hypothetical protein
MGVAKGEKVNSSIIKGEFLAQALENRLTELWGRLMGVR